MPGGEVSLNYVIVALVAGICCIYAIEAHFKRRRQSHQEGIVEISAPANSRFDIVVVHGLGANPEYTWTCKVPKNEIERLAVSESLPASVKEALHRLALDSAGHGETRRISLLEHVLKPEFPEARILSFCYNSDWFVNASRVTTATIADRLGRELTRVRSDKLSTPIIFIGHSFGGIVIKQTLLVASKDVVDNTCGIVFLGTPHNGSSLSTAAAIAAAVSSILGSDATLLFALKDRSPQLSDLEASFRALVNQQEGRKEKLKIVSFYERLPTFALGLFSIGLTVDASSAYGYASELIGVDVNHVDLNKSPKVYGRLTDVLHRLKSKSEPALNPNQIYVVEKLNPLPSAAFDPDGEEPQEHETVCHPNTRVDLLQRVKKWATKDEEKCIYWLRGMAGTGKSTIARTITRDFIRERHYVASFFFRRNSNEPERINPARVFPTIAAQLVRRLPSIASHVSSAVSDASASTDVTKWARKQQFEKLILGPLKRIDQNSTTPMTIIVVIDALDECDQDQNVSDILQALPDVEKLAFIKVKFLVTSRPETYICESMSKYQIAKHFEIALLHQEPMTKHDISCFLTYKLQEIRDGLNQRCTKKSTQLPVDWPGQAQITSLVNLAYPLFIFAATACRFIEDQRISGTPMDRLERILKQKAWDHKSRITATYSPTLEQMVHQLSGTEREASIREVKAIVGPIVLLARPLSANSLADLLGISDEIVDKRLESLHSILNVPGDPAAPVNLFHQSFRDFLLSSELSKDFSVDETKIHNELQSRCITVMQKLQEDMCHQEQPRKLAESLDKKELDCHLKPELQYACLYWVEHLRKSGYKSKDGDHVHRFLQEHFLHWLEALAWMGQIAHAVDAVDSLKSVIDAQSGQLSKYVYDVKRFIQKYRVIIERAPLQIYCSALVFAPANSIVKQQFQNSIPRWICQLPEVESDWDDVLQTLEGHSDDVRALAFSHDGKQLASASWDGIVKLWKSEDGTFLGNLSDPAGEVNTIAFSQDDKQLATASLDGKVKLWKTKDKNLVTTLKDLANSVEVVVPSSGREIDPIGGVMDHSDEYVAVRFLRDDKHLAVVSSSGQVLLWDLASTRHSCKEILFPKQNKRFGGDFVENVVISSNGEVVWMTRYGKIMLGDLNAKIVNAIQLYRDSGTRRAFACSEDHKQMAVGYSRGRVKLLAQTPNSIRRVKETVDVADHVLGLAFSPEGKRLAVASSKRMHLWNLTSDAIKEINTISHSSISVIPMALSKGGERLAWSSDHGTIRLWDTNKAKGQAVQHDRIRGMGVSFLENGKQLVSIWKDGTVKLVSIRKDGTVKLRTIETRAEKLLRAPAKSVYRVAFSPDSKQLAMVFDDHTIELWDLTANLANPKILKGHHEWVTVIAFSPDGNRLVSASSDNTVILWDLSCSPIAMQLHEPVDIVETIAFSHDGTRLILASYDKIMFLDLTSSPVVKPPTTFHAEPEITKVAISRNGILARANRRGEIKLEDLDGAGSQKELDGHNNWVTALAFSPDGKYLASASYDKTVRLWGLTSNLDEVEFQGCLPVDAYVYSMSFADTGHYLQTERGQLQFHSLLANKLPSSTLPDLVLVKDEWISINGEDVLWIPLDHRSDYIAVHGGMIGYFNGFGQSSVLGFNLEHTFFRQTKASLQ